MNQYITKTYKGGNIEIEVKIDENNNIWLTREQIAKLFEVAKNTISEHINNILKESELD